MNSKLINGTWVVLVGSALLLTTPAVSAKGCLKGAAVGGVAGHVVGHHGVIGAAAGCAIGRHRANKARTEQLHADKARGKLAPAHGT